MLVDIFSGKFRSFSKDFYVILLWLMQGCDDVENFIYGSEHFLHIAILFLFLSVGKRKIRMDAFGHHVGL